MTMRSTVIARLGLLVATRGAAAGGRIAPAERAPAIEGLCARKDDLLHIERNPSADLDDRPGSAYEMTNSSGVPSPLILERNVDLNRDGTPEMVFSDPNEAARDAQYLGWYVDCGGGAFYPLLTEYAGEYEIGKPTDDGWETIRYINTLSPEEPSAATHVARDTYRFDGSHYALVKHEKVRRPRTHAAPVPRPSPPKRLCDAVYCDSEGHCDGPSPPNCKH